MSEARPRSTIAPECPHALMPEVFNGLAAAYIVALSKVLGAAKAGLTQVMLAEMSKVLPEERGSNPGEVAANALRDLGLADEVEVLESDGRWVVRVRSHLLKLAHRLLLEEGIRESNLLPEALVVAASIRKSLGKPMRVTARIVEPGVSEVVVEEPTRFAAGQGSS